MLQRDTDINPSYKYARQIRTFTESYVQFLRSTGFSILSVHCPVSVSVHYGI